MSILRERLKTLSPELWQALENSWSIALTHWLPKVDVGSTTNSSNSYPHLRNLESHLDRVILGYESYHAQRGKKNILELSPAELYVICASILFHDIGRIYQNKDDKIYKNKVFLLNEYVDILTYISFFNNNLTVDIPLSYSNKLQKLIEKHISKKTNAIYELIDSMTHIIKNYSTDIEMEPIVRLFKNIIPNNKIIKSDTAQNIIQLLDDNIIKLSQKYQEIKDIFQKLKKAWEDYNIPPKLLREIEDEIKRLSQHTTSSENKSILTLLKTKIDGLYNYCNDTYVPISPPPHGYYTRRILMDENHYAELGIPSERLARVIANICEYHTNLDLPLETISINPYGKIRCRELGSLLTLIDEMDDSYNRVYNEYLKHAGNNPKDFKATFRQKTGDVYLDPDKHTIFSVIDNIEDEGLRKQYYKILQDKNERLEKLKTGLVCLGVYLQGWRLECDEDIYIVKENGGKYEIKRSYETCFYVEYLENVIDCMWNLSTQIFGAVSISYEQLAAKICEKDVEKVKMAVYRISILARSGKNESTKKNIGIWAGKDQWKWLVQSNNANNNNVCKFVTPSELKNRVKEGEYDYRN